MNWWWNEKQKVLKNSSPLIDGLLLALNTDELLFEPRSQYSKEEEKVAKEKMNSEMKIWKINCWRKVSLEMLCLVDEWIKHIKSFTRRIYWENQAH